MLFRSGILDASATTDPFGLDLTFQWSADPDNPEAVTIENANTAIADFELPATSGEYYFDLLVFNEDADESFGRTFVRKFESAGGSPFENDQTADWVMNAIMYEIFVRTHSPAGDLDGVTADIPRMVRPARRRRLGWASFIGPPPGADSRAPIPGRLSVKPTLGWGDGRRGPSSHPGATTAARSFPDHPQYRPDR